MISRVQAQALARALVEELAYTGAGRASGPVGALALNHSIADGDGFLTPKGVEAAMLRARDARDWQDMVWRALEVAQLADDNEER